MKHEAIYALYPQATTIRDGLGVFDKDGNKVEINMDLVNAWVDPNKYKYNRAVEYLSLIHI